MPTYTFGFYQAADDASAGDAAWSSVGDALTQDTNSAYIQGGSLSSGSHSTHRLKVYDCGSPGIVPTETISGISVRIRRSAFKAPGAPDPTDDEIYLLKAGVRVGSNKASVDVWPTSLGDKTYGGAADLWGTTWSPSDFGSGFGVSIRTHLDGGPTIFPDKNECYVDYVEVTVTTAGAPPPPGPIDHKDECFRDGGSSHRGNEGHQMGGDVPPAYWGARAGTPSVSTLTHAEQVDYHRFPRLKGM